MGTDELEALADARILYCKILNTSYVIFLFLLVISSVSCFYLYGESFGLNFKSVVVFAIVGIIVSQVSISFMGNIEAMEGFKLFKSCINNNYPICSKLDCDLKYWDAIYPCNNKLLLSFTDWVVSSK